MIKMGTAMMMTTAMQMAANHPGWVVTKVVKASALSISTVNASTFNAVYPETTR